MNRNINIQFESRETGEVFVNEGITIQCKDASRESFLNGIYKYLRTSGVLLGLLKYGWSFNIYAETILTAGTTVKGQINIDPFRGAFSLALN